MGSVLLAVPEGTDVVGSTIERVISSFGNVSDSDGALVPVGGALVSCVLDSVGKELLLVVNFDVSVFERSFETVTLEVFVNIGAIITAVEPIPDTLVVSTMIVGVVVEMSAVFCMLSVVESASEVVIVAVDVVSEEVCKTGFVKVPLLGASAG